METFLQTAQTLGAAAAQILLAIYFCKQYIDKYQKEHKTDIPEAVKEQSKIDIGLMTKMDYYKELLDADRVLLFEFHNGQHYSNYRTALKMSASYEVYKAGLSSTRETWTNIPISVMPNCINAITQEGYFKCNHLEDIKNDMGNSYEFKKALGIQAFYDIAIHDEEGAIIGFVAIQWNRPIEEFNELEINHLAWYIEEQVRLLTESSNKKNTKSKLRLFKKGAR